MTITSIEDALPVIFAEMLALRGKSASPGSRLSLRTRLTAIDIFEILVRLDDAALASSLSGTSRDLDRWTELDCPSLVRRLRQERGGFLMAALLTISPRGLGRMAECLPMIEWMEAARALNRVTADQLRTLARDRRDVEDYLIGASTLEPKIDMPWLFPFPAPSVLRIVQGTRFRMHLYGEDGYRQAMVRHARFFG